MARTEYEVVISGVDNGIVARIGCKTLVFHDDEMSEFFTDLAKYLTKGREGYKEVFKKYFGEGAESQIMVAPVPPPNYESTCCAEPNHHAGIGLARGRY